MRILILLFGFYNVVAAIPPDEKVNTSISRVSTVSILVGIDSLHCSDNDSEIPYSIFARKQIIQIRDYLSGKKQPGDSVITLIDTQATIHSISQAIMSASNRKMLLIYCGPRLPIETIQSKKVISLCLSKGDLNATDSTNTKSRLFFPLKSEKGTFEGVYLDEFLTLAYRYEVKENIIITDFVSLYLFSSIPCLPLNPSSSFSYIRDSTYIITACRTPRMDNVLGCTLSSGIINAADDPVSGGNGDKTTSLIELSSFLDAKYYAAVRYREGPCMHMVKFICIGRSNASIYTK